MPTISGPAPTCGPASNECASRAAGHEEIAAGERYGLILAQAFGQGLAHKKKARVGHVAVHAWFFFCCDLLQDLAELRRRWHIRVAQAEVKDLIFTELRLHACAFLEHLADHGRFLGK